MANLVVNNGLQRIGVQASQASSGAGPTYGVARHIQTLSIDDSATAFAAGHTALNSGGAVTSEFDVAFDATPTRTGQVITHVATIPTASGVMTIRRIALHDDTSANVTTSSATLVAGVDAQSLTKTADFSIVFSVTLTYTV